METGGRDAAGIARLLRRAAVWSMVGAAWMALLGLLNLYLLIASTLENAFFFGFAGFAFFGAIVELLLASRVQRFANRNANLS